MANEGKKPPKKLSPQFEAFLEILTEHGLVEDKQIDDEKRRKAEKEKKRKMYHNTNLLLQNYRDITWMLECFPANISEELDEPMQDLDALLSAVSKEIDLDNHKLENRFKSINKSRLLLDRVNEALTILKQKPKTGQKMYNIIYYTYIIPEELLHDEILFRVDISERHYYRLRKKAINILSIRLWASPGNQLSSWIDVLTILENL